MSHIIKDSFYKDRYYQISMTSLSDQEEIETARYKKLKELSKNPIDQNTIKESLQNFGKTASGSHYHYLSFTAIQKDLYSLIGIQKYEHLQHIDVSNNHLISLKPLLNLKYLISLNASHNKLKKCLDPKFLPHNLEELNLSHNQISQIENVTQHPYLKNLNLNNNKIQKINGLSENKNLEILKLQYNQITDIENLDKMNLVELDLKGNQIQQIIGLDTMEKLRILNLSCNQISKLKGLVGLLSIRELFLSNNKIRHVRQLQYIENLSYLSCLDLCFNPVQSVRYYRFQVLYHLPGLRVLDGVLTKTEEFVKSENLYGLDLEERRKIFKEILPDEEFIDRRINIGELIEPETESDNEEQIQFQDKYDREGNLIQTQSQIGLRKSQNGSLMSSKSGMGTVEAFRDTQNSHQSLMNETQRKLNAMRTNSLQYKENSEKDI